MTDGRSELRSRRRWAGSALAFIAAVVAAVNQVMTNAATNAMPSSWTWMRDERVCWPAVGILTVLGAGLAWWAVRAASAQPVYRESWLVKWPQQEGVVPRLADHFQKRQVQRKLDQVMLTKSTGVVTHVLSGLAGTGKTQLAIACARRVLRDRSVDLLVWVTATSRAAIQKTYADAACKVGGPQDWEWFLGWLQTTTRPWMVVLDDLRDPVDLQGLWPDGSTGWVLVTTQRADSSLRCAGRRLIRVDLFTPSEALAYLQQKITNNHAGRLDEAQDLADDLGRIPLALAQAAAFIENHNETCAGYRKLLRATWGTAGQYGNVRPRRLGEIVEPTDDYAATVAATWSISVQLADRFPPQGLARPTLQFASGLDPNGAPVNLFTTRAARNYLLAQRGARIPDGHGVSIDQQDCLHSLSNLGRLNLTSFDLPANMVCTHALVQRATLEQLSPAVLSITVKAVADALIEIWPTGARDISLQRVLWDCSTSLIERYGHLLWDPNAHQLLVRRARSLGECHQADAAIREFDRLLTDSQRFLKNGHPDIQEIQKELAHWRSRARDRPQ
jgi:NB-ARC domain